MRWLYTGWLLAWLCACAPAEPPRGVVEFPELDDKWIVLNYWAEWCAPCREEIPELNLLSQRSDDIIVYALNFDGVQGEALQQQAEELGIRFPLLAEDPGEQLGWARPNVLPTTLILSPEGREVTRLIGPQTEAGLRKELEIARRATDTEQPQRP